LKSEQAYSGLLMVGVLGEKLSPAEIAAFTRYPPGGVILFARNCVTPKKAAVLIAELQGLRRPAGMPPLLIAIDQEGGPVRRLREGFPEFTGAAGLGRQNDLAKTRAEAAELGRALSTIGINCNLAPVADLLSPQSRVLKERCFGEQPSLVAAQVKAYIEGLQKVGIAACVKHFPGHGTVVEDSHERLPVASLSRSELKPHLLPFAGAVKAGVRMMMAAHLSFPAIDAHSVPFSRVFLEDIARRELGFVGVLVSDDFDMAAVLGPSLAEVMVEGITAGLDLVLWGRNLRPLADPGPVLAEFCTRLRQSGPRKRELREKLERLFSLREKLAEGKAFAS